MMIRRLAAPAISAALLAAALVGIYTNANATTTLSFAPTDDAYVTLGTPNGNFGGQTTLVTDSGVGAATYLKFTVAGLTTPVVSAHLKLTRNSGTVTENAWTVASSAWTEGSLTYNNRPAYGTVISTSSTPTVLDLDLTGYVTGNGTFSVGVNNATTIGLYYSKEQAGTAQDPVLEIVAADPPTTTTTTTTTVPPTTTTTTTPVDPTPYPDRGSVGAVGPFTEYSPSSGHIDVRGAGDAGCVWDAVTATCTIEHAYVHGGLDLYVNAIIRDTKVEQNSSASWQNVVIRNGKSLLIEDSTICPTYGANVWGRAQDGILPLNGVTSSLIVRRVEFCNMSKATWLVNNVLVEDSWVHSMRPFMWNGSPVHHGSFMTQGATTGAIVRRTRMETNLPTAYNASTNPDGFEPTAHTGAVLLQPTAGSDVSNITIENSFLEGGYYALRMEQGSHVTHLTVRNNVFGPYPTGGGFWTLSPNTNPPTTPQIDVWSGNQTGDMDGNPTGTAIAGP